MKRHMPVLFAALLISSSAVAAPGDKGGTKKATTVGGDQPATAESFARDVFRHHALLRSDVVEAGSVRPDWHQRMRSELSGIVLHGPGDRFRALDVQLHGPKVKMVVKDPWEAAGSSRARGTRP